MNVAPPPLRFLCDEMLVRLGRWLRGAGYDTALPRPGEHDADLLARAITEDRLLLTRDRELTRRRGAAAYAVLVEGDTVEAQARDVTVKLGIDWLAAPFSRCLVCNTPVEPAPTTVHHRVPPSVRHRALPLHYCTPCDRIYWPGGHEARMRRTLEQLGR